MVDLTATNVALGGESPKRHKQWLGALEQHLNAAAGSVYGPSASMPGGPAEYVLVVTRYLVGVMIAVYAQRRWAGSVREVQDAVAPVGVMGVMGNKGGAAVRLRIADSTFCFVCAHLAAHRGAVAQRNADFASIMAKTEFRDDARAEAAAAALSGGGRGPGGGSSAVPGGGGASGSGGASSGLAGEIGTIGILDHDYVVWFGDFNYRIIETVSTERCFELAYGGEGDLAQLVKRDQLNLERAAGRSFTGFSEGPLTFRPTYKYQPGTSKYEQRPDKKLRAPAWCDRILWWTAPGVEPRHCRQLFYGSTDHLLSSDHKPVMSLFEVAVKTTIRDRRAAVVADITRQLDAMENRAMPKAREPGAALG